MRRPARRVLSRPSWLCLLLPVLLAGLFHLSRLLNGTQVPGVDAAIKVVPPMNDWPGKARPNNSRIGGENRNVFIDLGANCGNTFLKFNRTHGHERGWEVYLWEPSPQMFEYFLEELEQTDPSIRILPFAAGVANSTTQLFLHKGQEHVTDKSQFRDGGKCDPDSPYNPSGGSTVFNNSKVAGDSVIVKVLDFPSWLERMELGHGDRLILKVDIEGSELDIMDKMLNPGSGDSTICLTEVIEMEFHKELFDISKHNETYRKHENFQNTFNGRFREKCGRDVNLRILH